MTTSLKTAIIIPCYNEAESIYNVLTNLRALLPDACLITVNDASKDNTVAEIQKFADNDFQTVLLDLPVNLGIGGAVQTGFLYAARNHFDYAVKVDGDGQHPAECIEALLAPLKNNQADYVIGSRFLEKNGFQSTWIRRLGITFFRWINSLLIHQTVTDNTSGFRAYNRQSIEFAAKYYPSFDYPEPEEVILMAKNNFRILEIPVIMKERQGGTSSITPVKAVYYMLKVFFSVLMAALRSPVRKIR